MTKPPPPDLSLWARAERLRVYFDAFHAHRRALAEHRKRQEDASRGK